MTTSERIAVRRVTMDDLALARGLRLRALESDPTSFGSTYAREAAFGDEVWRERLQGSAHGDDGTTLVAFLDGTPAGMVSAFRDQDEGHVFQIVGMWVAPEARREGVGRRLLGEVESWIASCGANEIHLGVTNVATAARRLYETWGYTPDGTEDPSAHTPGVVEIRMRRRLT